MYQWLADFWFAIRDDFSDLPGGAEAGHLLGRLLVAGILSAVIGWERERSGKAAGLRTHILVGLAAALLVLVAEQAQREGVAIGELSRVIQGIITGIGFIGAGAIMKSHDEHQIEGLTTAAGLWLTTTVGIAAGLGRETSALLGTAMAVVTLWGLAKLLPGK